MSHFQMAHENPFMGLADVAAHVAAPAEDPVSVQTVSRRLGKAGIRTRVSSTQTDLSDEHKANRLLFAQNHLHDFSEDSWMTVKFSDEKTFRSDMSGKVYVRR